MELSKENLKSIAVAGLEIPDAAILLLPEKVLQFGTGVLLRGLPDYFIDHANKSGIFNGRVVIVKSTETGSSDVFENQDGLYTVLIRGFDAGKKVEEKIINASISRVLAANKQWNEILNCAQNPDLQVVVSNTTEVGITLTLESITGNPPASFPAKLLAFLWTRYQFFKGSANAGMVIVPAELISDNGSLLKSIILELADYNKLEQPFIEWLNTANEFCNSLVDRIVPGKLEAAEKELLEKELGYTDELMIMCEPYSLWAIEAKQERSKKILSFSTNNVGVKITDDIKKFKELKLRLLNGTHTFSCGLAILAGFTTVREAMDESYFRGYVSALMLQEIKPLIVSDMISDSEAQLFAEQVIDRFRNPSIEHKWINISAQFSLKMAMRNLPLIKKHYQISKVEPTRMLIGFAAYLLFMRTRKNESAAFETLINGVYLAVNDEKAELLYQHWQKPSINETVAGILSETAIWGENLMQLPLFANQLTECLNALIYNGTGNSLRALQAQNQANA